MDDFPPTLTALPANDVIADPQSARDEPVNLVRLRGRVTTAPEQRTLPSGTAIVTFRISVGRGVSPMTSSSKQTVDWVDCAAWGGRVRRSALGWAVGDVVEVEGALRRRFYRGANGTATRLEVEALGGRVLVRAPAPAG